MKITLLNILITTFCLITTEVFTQSTGDIAFVGFNADGDRDFAIVVLADITANTTIYFTDDETTGIGTPSALAGSEGTITWSTGPADIKAGTVVIFTDVDSSSNPNFGASIGSISRSGSFGLSASKDGVIAFLGTDEDTPTTYLAALQIGNDSAFLGPFDGDGITLTNTSLVIGTSIIVVDNSASPDGGTYIGSRSSETSYSDYYTLLENNSNWSTSTTDGESFLPFSQEAFTINSTTWTGASSSVWNLSGNWNNGIPTSSSSVSIPDVSTSPVISSGTTALAGNVTISSGEILTINSGNGLTVSGSLTVTGDLTVSSGGSLILKGTSSDNMTYNRNIGTTNWYLVSSPFVGQTIVDFYTNESPALGSGTGDTQNVAIAPYDNSQSAATDRWNYYSEGQVDGANGDDTTDTFTAGKGYSIKMQATGDVSFIGTLSTDDVDIAITDGSGGGGNTFNLLGNPFPSFIAGNSNASSSNNLLSINTASLTEATFWLWDQGSSTYDAFNQASSAFHIAPGQGFFVSSTGSNTFSFTEAMQSHQTTDTFRNSDPNTRPEILLEMRDGSVVRDADIYYIDGTTTGFDNGYDSTIFGGASNSFTIYTGLVSDSQGEKLGIQSLPPVDYENMIIPVGIIASSGSQITISANAINLPNDIKVFIEDKTDNSFTILDDTTDFTTTLPSDLNGLGRFFLHTTSLALSNDEANLDYLSIYTSSQQNLKIIGVQSGNANVRIYNIMGIEVLNSSFEGRGSNDITLPSLKTGVYIIKLELETGTINKKIIIQ